MRERSKSQVDVAQLATKQSEEATAPLAAPRRATELRVGRPDGARLRAFRDSLGERVTPVPCKMPVAGNEQIITYSHRVPLKGRTRCSGRVSA